MIRPDNIGNAMEGYARVRRWAERWHEMSRDRIDVFIGSRNVAEMFGANHPIFDALRAAALEHVRRLYEAEVKSLAALGVDTSEIERLPQREAKLELPATDAVLVP